MEALGDTSISDHVEYELIPGELEKYRVLKSVSFGWIKKEIETEQRGC